MPQDGMQNPQVSVLLPCFNAARHLAPCLASLARQTLADLEVVAVDDGSRDDTAARLAQTGDPRVRVHRQPHAGIASALATAARLARAPLLARMDADDIAHPERLARQAEFLLRHPEVDVVGSRVAMLPRGSLPRYESWVNGLLTHEQILADLFVESPLPHPSVMMRRESFERAGGYRASSAWPEDYDLWMRLALGGARFAKLPEVLLFWRDRPERASRTDPRYALEKFLALKEHYLMASFLAERRRVAIWGAGPVGKGWALRLACRGVEVSHFVEVDPRKIGKRIHGAQVIAPDDLARTAGAFLLVAVAAPGGREDIRGRLQAEGLRERRDYLCIA
jgi:glycosyltransferase involved in cell wall biosynthesis